jgi:hypothetical protein
MVNIGNIQHLKVQLTYNNGAILKSKPISIFTLLENLKEDMYTVPSPQPCVTLK